MKRYRKITKEYLKHLQYVKNTRDFIFKEFAILYAENEMQKINWNYPLLIDDCDDYEILNLLS